MKQLTKTLIKTNGKIELGDISLVVANDRVWVKKMGQVTSQWIVIKRFDTLQIDEAIEFLIKLVK